MRNLLLIILSLVFFSCSKEEIIKPSEEAEAKALVMIEVELKDGTKIYSEQRRP